MNSKIELRIESVKLAVNVEGVTPENIIEVSDKIFAFIQGDANLPETFDSNSAMKDMIKTFGTSSIINNDEEIVTETTEKA